MSRPARALAVLALAVAVGAPARSAPDAAPPLSLAVAAFERNAPPGTSVPDVDRLLADRLGTSGVERVVGPETLGAPPAAEPSDEDVRGWASGAGVGGVVVGRITRIGSQLSIDVHLRRGDTGAAAGAFVAEVREEEGVEGAVDRLAGEILDAMRGLPGSASPVASAPPPAPAASDGRKPFGIRFDNEAPVTIRSDELEAVKSGGVRRLLFRKNVVVTQDDVTIRSARLEAFYPPDTSQPERLVAEGQVHMTQGASEARCDEASYERARELLVCRGHAELQDADGCVAGERIEFDFAADTVTVKGGARVVINAENGSAPGGCP